LSSKINLWQKTGWESFTDLFEKINEIREILFDDPNWKLSRCSCWHLLKNYVCSHIIILAVTLKLIEFPQASMQIPIGPRLCEVSDQVKDKISNQFFKNDFKNDPRVSE